MISKPNAPGNQYGTQYGSHDCHQWISPRSKAGWLLGLLLGCLLLAACLLALDTQPAHAQESAQQTLDARLVKTIGITPGVCAPEGSVYLDVAPGTTVYICYTLTNTGSVALEPLALIDNYGDPANIDPVAWNKPPGFVLEPGAQLTPTAENGLIRAVTAGANLNSLAGWGLVSADGAQTKQITSNAVTINLVTLGTRASLSVSAARITSPTQCNSPSATLNAYQIPAYLCLTLTNASSITLTNHQIDIPGFGVSFPLTTTLGAHGTISATIYITNGDNSAMAPIISATSVTGRAFVTSTNETGSLRVSTVTEPVVVNGPAASVTFMLTPNFTPDLCSATNSLSNLTPSQVFYYCLILINNASSLTYTQHVFTEPVLKISGSFDEVLPPGGRISITNSYLQVNKGIAPFLGPITATQSVNSLMTYTASAPLLGYRAVTSASSFVSVLTPTPTSTDAPTPTNTPIPVDTPFWTPTMTPIPPTPTATWTWTPSPTPTPSPTVLTISTPGGAATPYPTLPGMVGGAQQTNPLDPVAATANAATATAQAQFAFPPTPVLDPFGATATAQAQFAFPTPVLDPFGATVTAQALLFAPPSPLDPFAATANAATATTQAQFAFPTTAAADPFGSDPFGGTATAQAQLFAPPSPLDPVAATANAATATTQAQFAFPTTAAADPFGSDPFGATATAEAQLFAPPSPLDPGADPALAGPVLGDPALAATAFAATATAQAQPPSATPVVVQPSALPSDTPAAAAILPPQFITVTATFTPQPPTTPTQRPIEPPTPAPTVDARSFFISVLDGASTTWALLWLLGGSVLFFVTAGVLAGLAFRAKEKTRFELDPDTQDAQFTVQPQPDPQVAPPTSGNAHAPANDDWPESLP